MDPDYVSDASMSNSFGLDGSDLSDASSEETAILLTPPSSPENQERVMVIKLKRHLHSGVPIQRIAPPQYRNDNAYRRTKCKAKLYVTSMGDVETRNHMPNCVPYFRRDPIGPPPAILDRTVSDSAND
ncbi:hypothetical protein PF001_g3851 [Phytophthora fragariae]|uniref:Uncharacterized protein n=1 Tax=Phytophthora fragariae TaxID=53985 RepID=A0A6A4EUS7_9STRA|nr:hypothetical protein PF001_g3851 [Phytophthora fragariae]